MVQLDVKTRSRAERKGAFLLGGQKQLGTYRNQNKSLKISGKVFNQSTGYFLVYYKLPYSFSANHDKFPLIKGKSTLTLCLFYPIRWLNFLSGLLTPSEPGQ